MGDLCGASSGVGKVERTIARLQSFRRVRARDERETGNVLAFVQLACILILPQRISTSPLAPVDLS